MKNKKSTVMSGFTHYTTKPSTGDTFIFHFNSMARLSRTEPGCLHFELFRSQTCPTCFVIYHRWKSAEDWETHLQSPHLKAFINDVSHIVETAQILEVLEPIEEE